MDESFLRSEMLLGAAAMEKLQKSRVAVFGLGGVGSWCAEALARTGVGALTLIDHDEVSLTNLNRQAEATRATVGQKKAEAMAERIRSIAPDCRLTVLAARYAPDCREDFFKERYDYIVDAIDMVTCKLDLIETALARGIPILSSMGTGNKLDASQLVVADLSQTEGCPLARVIRKELRARGILHHKVVFSPELPVTVSQLEAPPPGRHTVPASAVWVTASAGMLLAGETVRALIAE